MKADLCLQLNIWLGALSLQRHVLCDGYMFPLFQSLYDISLQLYLKYTTDTYGGCQLVSGLSLIWEHEGKKISEMAGRNGSGKQFLITARPKWMSDPREAFTLTSQGLICILLLYNISQLTVTPTDSEAKQYSTCFELGFMFKINLLKNAFLSDANISVQLNWLVTENRGVTARLVMLAEWGRWHGCRHFMLPCNFPTSCFFDKNRKSIIA